MNFKWNNIKLLNNILLMIMIFMGLFISMSGSNMFIMFLGMEMKMFGIIPFMLLNKENNYNKVNASMYYFLVQVFGSLTFLWGNMVGGYLIGAIGLCMKMGISPFFWWVPSMFKQLDWFSIMIIATIQKMPSFFILRLMFDMSSMLGLFMAMSGLMVSVMGINYKKKDLKVLMGWSSVGNMSLMCYLLMINMEAAYSYFFCYVLCFLMMSNLLLKNTMKKMKKKSVASMKADLMMMMSMGMLMFAGLPPLLGFQWKLFLFSGLKESEVMFMVQQMMGLKVKDYMIEFPLCQDMMGWKVSLMISMLLVIQIMSYMKIFINMYTSYSSSLEGSSRLNSNKLNLDIYMMMLILLSIIMLGL